MLCCSCRLSRLLRPRRLLPLSLLRPSRPLPAIGPGEPPEQQRAEAEADRVQEDQLAVAGHQRPRQQQRRPDRNRSPLVPPDEPDRFDPDALTLETVALMSLTCIHASFPLLTRAGIRGAGHV